MRPSLRPSRLRQARRPWLLATACVLAVMPPFPTRANEPLPADAVALSVLGTHPLWQSRLAQREVDLAQARQTAVGPGEWSLDLSGGARRYRGPASGEPGTREWQTGLSRPVRLPGQLAADEAVADAAGRAGEAGLLLGWHDLTAQVLETHGEWLMAARQAAIWASQADVAEQQAASVRKRVQLGDAARLDAMQAEAALAQARAQATAASQHLLALERRVNLTLPGWPLTPPPPASDSWMTAQAALRSVPSTLDEGAMQALLQRHPAQVRALALLDVGAQQARQADAARRGTPTVGVQLARDRSGAEQAVLLQVNVPLGSAYRDLAAEAQQAQFRASSAQQAAQLAEARATLQQRWQATHDAMARWQWQRDALARLEDAAQALDKGYRLGEGPLDGVLQARRLAREQALQAAQAETEAWLALWRWQLDAGGRWPPPGH